MKRFLLNNNWWIYFILTFLISWSIWIIGNKILPQDLRTINLIIGAFGPFGSAIIITGISKGKSNLKDWIRTIFNFRINIIWYLLGGIAFPFIIAIIHHLFYITLGGQSGTDLSLEWLLYN